MIEPKPQYVTSTITIVAVDPFILTVVQSLASGEITANAAARLLSEHQRQVVERALAGWVSDEVLLPDVSLTWLDTLDNTTDLRRLRLARGEEREDG